MRTRNPLERLEAAGRPLDATADSLVDAGEEDAILSRILATPRSEVHGARRRRAPLALAGVAVVVAAIAVASVELSPHSGPAGTGLRLTGASISLAGFHFRTPAGYHDSSSSCGASVTDHFDAAASADGGCVEAAYLIAESSLQGALIPTDAQPVDVGQYPGYFAAQSVDGKSALYIKLPNAADDEHVAYLVLLARDLTEDQLVAVAESGLPASP